MRFANETEMSEAVRLSAGQRHGRVHRGILFTDEAILWLAESQWNLADRNPHQFGGFPEWRDLPDHVKAHWIRNAQDWIAAIMDKTRLANEFGGIEGLRPVDPESLKDYEKAMTEEVIPQLIEDQKRRRGY